MIPVGFGPVAEQLRRSTVQIQSRRAGGSGVIWTADGTIVTNSHVLSGDTADVVLWDGQALRARVETRDARRDLLKLHVAATGLPAVQVRSSGELRPGELVIAVGNPLGFLGAVTTGTVQRVARWVEANVRLLPGNSGGPLADAQGRVVGINSMIAGGVALAVPSDAATGFVQRDGPPPMLGVTVRPLETAHGFAWLVLGVEQGSAAERASLLPGDLLLGGVEIDRGPVPIQFVRPGSDRLRHVTAVIEP